MAIYFTDKYKKIHDSLENSSEMSSLSKNMMDETGNCHNEVKKIASQIDASNWIELGKVQLTGEFMQILSDQMGVLNQSIAKLGEAVEMALGSLLPKLKNLKEKDEKLEELKKEMDSLGNPPVTHDSNGNVNPYYRQYINKQNQLAEQINSLNVELKNLVLECDKIINNINSIKPEKIKVRIPTGGSDNAKYVKSNMPHNYLLTNDMFVSRDGKMLNYGEYSVVDTPFGLVDYFNYIQKNRVYQDGSDSTNACHSVAHFYAKSMLMREKYSGPLSAQLHSAAGDVYFKNRRLNEPNKQVALAAIYEELKAGRPVAIDVKRKKPGGRHVVTVVGFKSNVKSAADLRSEDLLILDTWDGQIERMDTQTSRVMASGAEVSQGYKGFRVTRLGGEKFQEAANARIKVGLNA